MRGSRRIGLIVFLILSIESAAGQANQWTWIGGSRTVPSNTCEPGVYGTLSVAAEGNQPGGREWAASWTDKRGRLWLYGGEGCTGITGGGGWLNDLWEFDPNTNEWTWMGGDKDSPNERPVYGTKGVFAAANSPGGRGNATTWTDRNGAFWLFGGFTNATGWLNDLWEFDPVSAKWAWINGTTTDSAPGSYGSQGVAAASNLPPGRLNAEGWVDAEGNLWLFGGYGLKSGGYPLYFNDLWKYSASANEWTWMAGSNTTPSESGQPGIYGTLGSPSAGNAPGGRSQAIGWTDSSGNFWLFGGEGVDANGNLGFLNDFWKFSSSSNTWTWMGGGNTMSCEFNQCYSTAVFGDLGTPAPETVPGGRSGALGWVDKSGNFWLFGGDGYDNLVGPGGDPLSALHGYMNDLWKYDPGSNQWAWMGGSILSQLFKTRGYYGTLGAPAPGNVPGGRKSASSWIDAGGNFRVFGGNGNDALSNTGALNDLWEYQPSSASLATTATPTFVILDATDGTPEVWFDDATTGSYFFYTVDGTTPSTSSYVYRGGIPVQSTFTVKVIAIASGCYPSSVASATYTNSPVAAAPVFSLSAGTYSSPQVVTISDATPGAIIYYTTDGTQPWTLSPAYSGAITISANTTLRAFAGAAGYGYSPIVSASYAINVPTPAFELAASSSSLSVDSGGSGTMVLTITPQNGFNSKVSFGCSGLPIGATCSFNPATVTPSGGAVTTTITISTAKKSASLVRLGRSGVPIAAFAIVFSMFGVRRVRQRGLVLLIFVMSGLVLLSACGGGGTTGGGGGGSNPVTYMTTVTATSGSLQQTATIALTVN